MNGASASGPIPVVPQGRLVVPEVTRSTVASADTRQVLTLDEKARAAGLTAETLVAVAAERSLPVLRELAGGSLGGRHVALVVGKGAKGAAALHLADVAAKQGAKTVLILARDRKEYAGVARAALGAAEASAEKVHEGYAERPFENADLVVDGLVGCGLKGKPKASVSLIVKGANFALKPLLALDLPTGIDPTTGPTGPGVIRAKATVTVAIPKRGLLLPASAPYVGDLYLADLGIPAPVYAAAGLQRPSAFDSAPLVRLL